MNCKKLTFRRVFTALALLCAMGVQAKDIPVTQRQYLSGRGSDDMVEWDFFCTEGRNSGKWTKIGVPSCWELQGFGTYQYGITFYGKPFPDGIAKEKGMYKYEFTVPEEFRGKQINLVFEASMTDTEVKMNGRKAGSKHQGAFYRFQYNVTDLLKYGQKNLLEVTVSKESENASVNLAERRADYWNFGGIFRPVFLDVRPAINISQISINALADGSFSANCQLNIAREEMKIHTVLFDSKGKKVAETTAPVKVGSDWTTLNLNVTNPALWTAETPNLYRAEFTLLNKNGEELHHENTKFGFRTIEVRKSDGLYINGKKILVKGVNRHSFRPESGRTLNKKANIEDVLLIKSMNMNAVRLSHYPADPEFFEACDSLGLYVMDELGGWHGKYDTPTGIKLIGEMIPRDVNHPSIIWWSNGNEKGWNTELDREFHKYDPQCRPVLHPQGNYGGFETMHYRSYGESQNYMRLPEIFMPTEFLHGLYDGGHGAGLYDYWEMMRKHPRCAGGFLWVLADEGVKRVDMDGFIDNQGNYGADGIVGPHHEKEGSYYTIKELWSPVRITPASKGVFNVENRYDFLNTNTCRFVWKQVKFPLAISKDPKVTVIKQGEVQGIDLAPHTEGKLDIGLNNISDDADAILMTVIDRRGDELYTWSFHVNTDRESKPLLNMRQGIVKHQTVENNLIVTAGNHTFTFSNKDGELKGVTVNGKKISFANGPRFIGARRADRSLDQFYNHDDEKAKSKDRTYTEFEDAARFTGFDIKEEGSKLIVTANYRLGNIDSAQWTISNDGTAILDYVYNFSGVVDLMGVKFDYPEEKVKSKTWLGNGPYRVWQNRLHGTTYNLWSNEYNDPIPGETFTYPEFKGYFSHVSWMNIETEEGTISIENVTPTVYDVPDLYVGVYEPRDGRDRLLYTFPKTGISLMNVIPSVRNKVNATDLCGPSSQPKWVDGQNKGRIVLRFW